MCYNDFALSIIKSKVRRLHGPLKMSSFGADLRKWRRHTGASIGASTAPIATTTIAIPTTHTSTALTITAAAAAAAVQIVPADHRTAARVRNVSSRISSRDAISR